MSETFDIELQIVSHPRYLCVARAAVAAAAEKYGFDQETVGQVMLAVDEAVTNVIRHGYDGAEDQPVWVRMGPNTPDGHPGFTIIVEDRGRQIDPDAIRGRDLDQVRPGGLGVHIIRNVMDEATYARRPDRGMRLTMAKRLTPAAEVEEGQES